MACPYIRKGGGSGTLIYCESPEYCGGNPKQQISGRNEKSEYCYGNYRTCPNYNNLYIGSSKSQRIKENDGMYAIVSFIFIIELILFFIFKLV